MTNAPDLLLKEYDDTGAGRIAPMTEYFAVVWDFELEESGEVVKDAVLFTDLGRAKEHECTVFIAVLDNDFSQKAMPLYSKRLGKSGYIVGDKSPMIKRLKSPDAVTAMGEVLQGRGEEIVE